MTIGTPHGIRLESGVLIPKAVEQAAQELSLDFCDVSGFGELEWADLAHSSEERPVRFAGPLQMVDLKGRLRSAGNVMLSDFVCTLARRTDNGIQMLGGVLKGALVRFAEITFTPLTAPLLGVSPAAFAREPATETPLKNPKLVSDSSLPRSPVAPEVSTTESQDEFSSNRDARWAKAVEESARVQKIAKEGNSQESDDLRPKIGDIVNHQQFGRCTVVRIGDDHVTLRKPDKRTVPLGLTVLKFAKVGEEDGRTVFRVQVQPKR